MLPVLFFLSRGVSAFDVAVDVPYLHAIASVHEFCNYDFELLCGGRRLGEVVVSMTALLADDEDEDEVDHAASTIPLLLGPRGDRCLRDHLDQVNEACYRAVSLVDATAYQDPPPSRLPFFFLASLVAIFSFVKFTAHRMHVAKVMNAIRADPDLARRVQRASSVRLPVAPLLPRDLFTVLLAIFLAFAVSPIFAIYSFVLIVGVQTLCSMLCDKQRESNKSNNSEVQPPSSYEPPTLENPSFVGEKEDYVPLSADEEQQQEKADDDGDQQREASQGKNILLF